MEGPREGPRIINGSEIIYGTRSASDMQSWVCKGCQTLNEAIRLLVFDVAPMNCRNCKLPNPNKFSFCLANVKMNGIELIDEVKLQKPNDGECVSYAASHLVELMNRILVAISSEEPDLEKANFVLDPDVFAIPYARQFPIYAGGFHKLIHVLQRLTNGIGIRLRYKYDRTRLAEEYFQGSEIRMIHCDDFEEVCRQIADGNAVLAPFVPGAKFGSLKYCEFYTSVTAPNFWDSTSVPGHVLLLVGAHCENNNRAYFALDSSGKKWCLRRGEDESFISVFLHGHRHGGVGKITPESQFLSNFFKLSRPGDKALPPKLYEDMCYESIEDEVEGEKFPKLDLVIETEPEDAVELGRINRHRIHHGPYFKRLLRRGMCWWQG